MRSGVRRRLSAVERFHLAEQLFDASANLSAFATQLIQFVPKGIVIGNGGGELRFQLGLLGLQGVDELDGASDALLQVR